MLKTITKILEFSTKYKQLIRGVQIKNPERPKLEYLSYNKSDKQQKTGRKTTVETLEKLFSIPTYKAYNIATKYTNLCKVTNYFLTTNYTTLRSNGIDQHVLLKYPYILLQSDVEAKLQKLKKLPFVINDIAPLLALPFSQLSMQSKENLTYRLNKICELLQIDVETACDMFMQKPFLRTIPLDKAEKNIKLLTSYGISTEDICKDLWVLRYKSSIIDERLKIAKNNNMDRMKTWMVRAKSDIMENYIRRRSDNKLILGNSSLPEYLSERLECTVDFANYLISKQPVLQNKSLKKIKEIIDLLYSQGFCPNHICRVPKILVHSTQTTRERLRQLSEKNLRIDSVHILTKSQKQFTQYYEALLKKQK